jgi:anti-sigma factor ChrR (cupin superfamily)
MDHLEASLLLGAYAAHALDRDERHAVTLHVNKCTRCRAEVSRYEYILSLLALPRDDS